MPHRFLLSLLFAAASAGVASSILIVYVEGLGYRDTSIHQRSQASEVKWVITTAFANGMRVLLDDLERKHALPVETVGQIEHSLEQMMNRLADDLGVLDSCKNEDG